MMTMQLEGVPMPLPLKDENGNLIPDCIEDQQEIQARNLAQIVRRFIEEVNNTDSGLSLRDDIQIYAPDPQSGFERPYFVVTVDGGLNGNGIWSTYFQALSELLLKLELKFEDAWVHEAFADACDDLFVMHIGIYPYEGQLDKTEDFVIRQ